jgi:hypothetical protein
MCVNGTGSLTLAEWMWWINKGVVGRPRLLSLFRILDAAVQADRHVSIAQLEIRFNLSRGTIWDIVHKRLGYR